MTYKSFEEFLQIQHDKQYIGTADDAPDDYGDWIDGLSTDEWIEFGEQYGNLIKKEYGSN